MLNHTRGKLQQKENEQNLFIMRNLVIVFTLVFLTASCYSPEKKAQNLIKQYLKESLHDWKSYEPVKFGSLDSLHTTLYSVKEFVLAKEEINRFGKIVKDYLETAESLSGYQFLREEALKYAELARRNIDSMKVYEEIANEISSRFIPEFVGWSMTHSFRANNAGGNKVIGHREYIFNKELTIILNSEDIGEK